MEQKYKLINAIFKHAVQYIFDNRLLPVHRAQKPYHTAEFLRLYDQKVAAVRSNRPDEEIRELTKSMSRNIRQAKRRFISRLTEESEWAGIKRQKPFRGTQTRVKNKEGLLVGTHKRAEVFAEHYADKQWAEAALPPLPQRPPLYGPAGLPLTPFTPTELRKVAKRLKKGKAFGTDGLPNEYLRLLLGVNEGFCLVLDLMNDCWSENRVPGEWMLGRIAAIFKHGNTAVAENYRPISVLQTMYKLFTGLLETRLREAIGHRISKHQAGYQKKKSVADAIFKLLRLGENADNCQNFPVYMLLLDWAKCFDRFHREPLLDAMRRLGVEPKYLDVLRNIYSNMQFFVQDRFSASTIKPQITGLRQGDPLSCFLMIAVFTVIMADAETLWIKKFEEYGIPANCTIKSQYGFDQVLYADDSNVAQHSLLAAKLALHAIQTEALFYGQELNLAKTFLLRFGAAKKFPTPNLKDFRGFPVPEKDSASTLGFALGGTVSNKQIVGKRCGAMQAAMNQYRLVWQSNLPKKKKIQKYRMLVVNKGLWGLHMLTLHESDLRRLDYNHVRCLRRILKLKAAYVSRISNQEVLRRAGLPPFRVWVRENQYRLLGHILRHPTAADWQVCFQRDTQLEWRPPIGAKRRVGRPRDPWAEKLLRDFQKKYPHYDRRQIQILAQDRSRWRVALGGLST